MPALPIPFAQIRFEFSAITNSVQIKMANDLSSLSIADDAFPAKPANKPPESFYW